MADPIPLLSRQTEQPFFNPGWLFPVGLEEPCVSVGVGYLPDAEVHEYLAPLLVFVRRIGARDFDHAVADALGVKAGTSVVRAEIVHERVVIDTNQHQPQFYFPVGAKVIHPDPSTEARNKERRFWGNGAR